MNILHYLIGFYHYIGTLICIISESEGFVKGIYKYLCSHIRLNCLII